MTGSIAQRQGISGVNAIGTMRGDLILESVSVLHLAYTCSLSYLQDDDYRWG